jgi:hypothetical protein
VSGDCSANADDDAARTANANTILIVPFVVSLASRAGMGDV